jgi:hypothetical protein
MAKYKLLEKSFIDNRLWEEGETVEVADELIPGPHMVPVDAAAHKMAKKMGLVNGPIPDPVDALTLTEAEKMGASPQGIKSGIAASDAQMP